MKRQGLVLHAHSFAVYTDNLKKYPSLGKEMRILQTDVDAKGGRFIDAMESKKYPIFATMYHPEYQLLDFVGSKKWDIK